MQSLLNLGEVAPLLKDVEPVFASLLPESLAECLKKVSIGMNVMS